MEDNKVYTVILSDGTELTDLEMNGNNFVSKKSITEATFEGKLSSVLISDGENDEEHGIMALIHVTPMQGAYWFALRDLTAVELENMKTRSDIEYIAMMCDVEL